MSTVMWAMLDARSSMNLLMTLDVLFDRCVQRACYRHSFSHSPDAAHSADPVFTGPTANLYAPYQIRLERVS